MSTLVDINTLASTRPTVDASVTAVAAWYERKAVVLRRIADTCGSLSEHDTYEAFAERAHQRAVQLLRGGGSR